jgi:sirohydrochlorin cobaltochelatase
VRVDAVQSAEKRLQALLPEIYRGRTDDVKPVSMGSAPLAFDVEGNVAWERMWGTFCDLAMAGGPPHKGKLLEPAEPQSISEDPLGYEQVCSEIARGVQLAAKLRTEAGPYPGWLRVKCANDVMAQWLLRAITMENVSVRLEESAVLLPAGPTFRLEKEIKNVITVVSKTAHYWSGHLHRLQQIGIANVFAELDTEFPLLQPCWEHSAGDTIARIRIQSDLEVTTGLKCMGETYKHWMGLEVGSVSSAVVTMRRLVASNILCRREESAIFVPFNPKIAPDGVSLGQRICELLPDMHHDNKSFLA